MIIFYGMPQPSALTAQKLSFLFKARESKVSGDGKGERTDIGKGHCLDFHSGFGFESKNNGQPS